MSKAFRELLHGEGEKYVVHCPKNDDYLVNVNEGLTEWHPHPRNAKFFRRFEKAFLVATALSLAAQKSFWVCKVDDRGKQLRIKREILVQPEGLPTPEGTSSLQDDLTQEQEQAS